VSRPPAGPRLRVRRDLSPQTASPPRTRTRGVKESSRVCVACGLASFSRMLVLSSSFLMRTRSFLRTPAFSRPASSNVQYWAKYTNISLPTWGARAAAPLASIQGRACARLLVLRMTCTCR
jgi:hypothetical protein